MKREFEELEQEITATRLPGSCDCVEGKIISVDWDSANFSKSTLVEFIPKEKTEACCIRIAGFVNAPKLMEEIKNQMMPEVAPRKIIPINRTSKGKTKGKANEMYDFSNKENLKASLSRVTAEGPSMHKFAQ